MGRLSYNNKTFYFRSGQPHEKARAKFAGFNWSTDDSVWWCTHPMKAIRLREFSDVSAKEIFDQLLRKRMELPERLCYPHKMKPRDYQTAGAWHILSWNYTALGDEPGLGKTVQALIAMNSVPGKTLIICPPNLIHNWEREIWNWMTQWYEGGQTVSIIDSECSFNNYASDILILPDSLVDRPDIRSNLSLYHFEWCFVDEAHRLKERSAGRTKAVYGNLVADDSDNDLAPIFRLSKRVCVMSGTLMLNRPKELFTHLKALAPETIDFAEFNEYAEKYCEAYDNGFEIIANGASNLTDLRDRVRKDFLLIRYKADVLKELPAKTREFVYLDGMTAKTKAFQKSTLKNTKLEEFVGDDNPLGEMAVLRRMAGEDMIKPAVAYIKDILEETDEKIIVFGWHRDVIELIAKKLSSYQPLLVIGGTGPKRAHANVDRFQTDITSRLLMGNIEALGTGHTATAARRVIVVEPSWVGKINEQAEDRAHRFGQKCNLLVQYLILHGSFTEYMMGKVFDKTKNTDAVMA